METTRNLQVYSKLGINNAKTNFSLKLYKRVKNRPAKEYCCFEYLEIITPNTGKIFYDVNALYFQRVIFIERNHLYYCSS